MWNSDGSVACVKPPHTCASTFFFSVRSRASMVDGDAIVEKLNRSDGNSRPYTWPLATYVYAYVHLTHSRTCIYFFLDIYTHWKIRYTVRSDEYCVSVEKISIFLCQAIETPVIFCILWFLSKYLYIIYDGDLDEAICLRHVYRAGNEGKISIFFKP